MLRLSARLAAFIAIIGAMCPIQEGIAGPNFLSAPKGSLKVTEGVIYNLGGVHRGIDYHAPFGTVIRAAADGYGITSFDSEAASLGQFVLIRHDNGYSTLYAHLSLLNVFKSFPYSQRHFTNVSTYEWQRVFKGQIIGFAGSSGTDVSHLHFEVARNPSGTWQGHYDGKLDPYDIDEGKAPYYPPVGPKFTGCGTDQLWLPSDQTCPTNGGGDPTLDQVNDHNDNVGFGLAICSADHFLQTAAQTFTVGVNGRLAKLDLSLTRFEPTAVDDFIVSVYPVSGFAPDTLSAALFTQTYTAASLPLWTGFNNTFTSFDVSSGNIEVSIGDMLAVVVSRPSGDCTTGNWVVWSGGDDFYSSGALFIDQGSGLVPDPDGPSDASFRSYVTPR